MKKLFVIFITILTIASAKAQQGEAEYGFFAGTSFYTGDVNLSKYFYKPGISAGLVYRNNFTDRYVLRMDAIYSQLRASDADFKTPYNSYRSYNFSFNMIDLSVLCEFNFLPYDKAMKNKYFTPYVTSGISVLVMPAPNLPFQFAIPMTFGFKYAINKKISLGAEWTARKTFSDVVDKLRPAPFAVSKQRTFANSKDWYSMAGIVLTVQFVPSSANCPAYLNSR